MKEAICGLEVGALVSVRARRLLSFIVAYATRDLLSAHIHITG